jgi:molybdopterin-synthase adenylyltransferase
MTLTEYDEKRYHRQIIIPGFGPEGQQKLKNSTVFVAGAGGLGSPVAIYLAVAGIGRIILVDMDVVDPSNLNRQILHWDENVGQKKVESGGFKLRKINPEIRITALDTRIDEENVYDLTQESDIIVDAMDNYPIRYLLNKAAFRHNIPFIHASVWGLGGQLMTVIPGKTPCLSCLVHEEPPKEVFPVLGATPGVLGTLQVTEVIKLLTGVGRPVTGRLILYDGEFMKFHEIPIERDPDCPVCKEQ